MPPSGPESLPAAASDDAAAQNPRIVVVSDAGPLISLGRLDLIGPLVALFADVQVPEVVIRECLARRERAQSMCLKVTGTLGVLVRARQQGLVGPLELVCE